jgi:hypothetical protein
MDFRGLAGGLPCGEQREATVRHVEVRGADGDEQRRRMRGNVHVLQRRAVDRDEEIGRRVGLRSERRADGDAPTGRETDDADAVRIDAPFARATAHERERRLRIGHCKPENLLQRGVVRRGVGVAIDDHELLSRRGAGSRHAG